MSDTARALSEAAEKHASFVFDWMPAIHPEFFAAHKLAQTKRTPAGLYFIAANKLLAESPSGDMPTFVKAVAAVMPSLFLSNALSDSQEKELAQLKVRFPFVGFRMASLNTTATFCREVNAITSTAVSERMQGFMVSAFFAPKDPLLPIEALIVALITLSIRKDTFQPQLLIRFAQMICSRASPSEIYSTFNWVFSLDEEQLDALLAGNNPSFEVSSRLAHLGPYIQAVESFPFLPEQWKDMTSFNNSSIRNISLPRGTGLPPSVRQVPDTFRIADRAAHTSPPTSSASTGVVSAKGSALAVSGLEDVNDLIPLMLTYCGGGAKGLRLLIKDGHIELRAFARLLKEFITKAQEAKA